MIAFVHGMTVDMTENSVVVEAGGIGYEIYMTGADLSEIRMGNHPCIGLWGRRLRWGFWRGLRRMN